MKKCVRARARTSKRRDRYVRTYDVRRIIRIRRFGVRRGKITGEKIIEEISRVVAKTMEESGLEDDSELPVYQATNGNVGRSRRFNRE